MYNLREKLYKRKIILMFKIQKLFKCAIPQQQFCMYYMLEKISINEKSFKCAVCSSKFANMKEILLDHIRNLSETKTADKKMTQVQKTKRKSAKVNVILFSIHSVYTLQTTKYLRTTYT